VIESSGDLTKDDTAMTFNDLWRTLHVL